MMKKTLATLALALAVLPVAAFAADSPAANGRPSFGVAPIAHGATAGARAASMAHGPSAGYGYGAGRAFVAGVVAASTSTTSSTVGTSTSTVTSTRG
ncbi:hypothetical protein [Dickeya undicola]|uniref:Uncharacterized protein n=1 Tax=Dickeya undicola TaxID=1577887 RepID=A0A3N0FZZ6_9GAMM|nr:hypothetical protein [Dickeya undicola]RNM05581.1 hypothetical protein EF878_12275 [Dickeya undicola]RNM21869.1 hypothetical protein EFS38_14685 [Dickeya undicola]